MLRIKIKTLNKPKGYHINIYQNKKSITLHAKISIMVMTKKTYHV